MQSVPVWGHGLSRLCYSKRAEDVLSPPLSVLPSSGARPLQPPLWTGGYAAVGGCRCRPPPVRVRPAAQQLAGLHRVPRPGTYPGGNAGGAKPALPCPLWAHKKWRCGSPMLISVLLVCCSWPLTASLPRLACGENLPHRWPGRKTAGSWGGIDARLPWYTSGFK